MTQQTVFVPTAEYNVYLSLAIAARDEVRRRIAARDGDCNQRVTAGALLVCAAPVLILVERFAAVYTQVANAGNEKDQGDSYPMSGTEIAMMNRVLPALRTFVDTLMDRSEAALDGSLPGVSIEDAANCFDEMRRVYEKAQTLEGISGHYVASEHEVEAMIIECLRQFVTLGAGFMLDDDDVIACYQQQDELIESLAILRPLISVEGVDWKPGQHTAAVCLLPALKGLSDAIGVEEAKLPKS